MCAYNGHTGLILDASSDRTSCSFKIKVVNNFS